MLHSESKQSKTALASLLLTGAALFSSSQKGQNGGQLNAVTDANIPNGFPVGLAGVWIRDQEASDMRGYTHMLELLQLSGLQRRTAIQFIEGLELEPCEEGARIKFLTVVPFFQVTEFVDFSQEVTQKRRDLRSGGQIARTQPLPNGMYVEMTWGEPLPGRLTETYRTEKDTLYVESTIDVAGGKEESLVKIAKLALKGFVHNTFVSKR